MEKIQSTIEEQNNNIKKNSTMLATSLLPEARTELYFQEVQWCQKPMRNFGRVPTWNCDATGDA